MRVLHVAQPRDGGVAAYVTAAVADQLARGWDVAVACPPDGRLAADLARTGVPHRSWPATRGPGRATPGELRALGRLLRSSRPDVVHLHAAKAGLAGRLHLRGRIPTLFQPHGWSWLAADGVLRAGSVGWERAAARWADRLVCVGDEEAALGRAARVRGRYAVIRSGVDLQHFRPAGDAARRAARARLGVPARTPLAVCVGRLTRQKGQDVLLAAWERVAARCPDARLALVGDGDLLPALLGRAGTGVTFAGDVTDVRDWLAAADVVTLPSRWEGLPLTALEAMATGRSVVASDIPGIAGIVTARTGALVPPERPTPLADALLCRLLDLGPARAEGAAAALHASGFDARRTYAELADLTRSVAAPVRSTATVAAPGPSTVAAPGLSTVVAPGPSTIAAPGLSTVVARGPSTVVARGPSTVVAPGLSTKEAR
ncbi:glycosyltransferase [Dactylosporangium siamense]|uniref:Glycosyl transferase family 1 n=1 Tax=Dactylosporangium siamense TaxID=685454 RepID=A0A919PHK5_9ACTN|nr:glycosyltransferase [Dactylosporangium siamense]GIG43804.1 glycosyl transferase family 1 [Dactylosporangium siamense]